MKKIPRCRICNRTLRNPAQIAAGIGAVCARKFAAVKKRYKALVGEGGDRPLFPEDDQPLTDQASEALERSKGKRK